jgi:hypothetical protein
MNTPEADIVFNKCTSISFSHKCEKKIASIKNARVNADIVQIHHTLNAKKYLIFIKSFREINLTFIHHQYAPPFIAFAV